jgi:alpha-beta hydrolase superfamily lysophospholipase
LYRSEPTTICLARRALRSLSADLLYLEQRVRHTHLSRDDDVMCDDKTRKIPRRRRPVDRWWKCVVEQSAPSPPLASSNGDDDHTLNSKREHTPLEAQKKIDILFKKYIFLHLQPWTTTSTMPN